MDVEYIGPEELKRLESALSAHLAISPLSPIEIMKLGYSMGYDEGFNNGADSMEEMG